MIKYFYCSKGTGYLLVGLCLISSSLSGRESEEGQEEIAQGDFHTQYEDTKRPLRMGDWDYKENWQYSRKAFFNGETQAQAFREHHPYGPAGIGYDADEDYLNYLKERRERLRDR